MEVVVSLLKNALKLLYQGWPIRASKGDFGNGRWRHCRIEKIESRQMLSITGPEIQIGAVYFEDAQGQDQVGDLLEITFSGGAEGNFQEVTHLILALCVLKIDRADLDFRAGDGQHLPGFYFFNPAMPPAPIAEIAFGCPNGPALIEQFKCVF